MGVAIRAARKMVRPAAFGQLIILLVFAPILTLEGVEGKTFQPMAATFMLALVGAFILGILSNGLNLMGVPSYYQQVIKGAVLILAIMLDLASKRRR